MEILLNKSKSISSVNTENNMSIELDNKNKLLPNESIVDTFSRYEQYVKERDECEKYRVLINIIPYCSNVLFNGITEITINDGTNECECLNFEQNGWNKDNYAVSAINSTNPIKYYEAIKNTEYSNENSGNFNYHCGFDIFNNHMLRKKTFIHVNKFAVGYSPDNAYNTISDHLRNSEGKVVKENIRIKHTDSDLGRTELHLYNTDSLYSIKDAFYNNAKEENGWWGFYNPGTIKISNGEIGPSDNKKDYDINNMLSNRKACEFIDFYPDRSLFSFIPKYNKKRKRIEKNWDYCLTYAYDKDYDLINKICGSTNSSVKVKFKVVTNKSGVKLLQCSSYFKHNLDNNSYINFYYYMNLASGITDEEIFRNAIRPLKANYYAEIDANIEEPQPEDVEQRNLRDGDEPGLEEGLKMYKYIPSVSVYSVGDLNGDNTDRIFSVKYEDIKKVFIYFSAYGCYYKKVTNGIECSYYARKFKKILNENNEELCNEINKAAFSTNIYGDRVAQLLFTDTINIKNLYDVNGRKVNEIFLTVVKRNAGNNKWYVEKNTGSEEVEISHCFGKLTSGVDFSGIDVNEEPFDYNVHYLHSIDASEAYNQITQQYNQQFLNTVSAWGDTILMGMPEYIESGITIDNDVFYGDIVEFDNALYRTTVIANICHRFNTMQRELFDDKFRDMYQDVIVHDDYEINLEEPQIFSVERYYVNDYVSSLNKVDNNIDNIGHLVYGNIFPEGYFYVPNFRIKIKEEGDLIEADAKYVEYTKFDIIAQNEGFGNSLDFDDEEQGSGDDKGGYIIQGYFLKLKVTVDYGFVKGDFIALYDKNTMDVIWGEIKSFKNMILTLYFDVGCFSGVDILNNQEFLMPNNYSRRYFAFWSTKSVPTYAKLNMENKKFVWRPLLKLSETNKNSDLFDTPFSNGHLYIQKNMNFYLKRQDPNGNYGLSSPLYMYYEPSIPNPMVKFVIDGHKMIDFSKLQGLFNNLLDFCF